MILLALVALATTVPFTVPTAPFSAAQSATTVQYRAGWNLVSAPTGTLFDKAAGPAYALDPGADGYRIVQPGEIVAGRAVWLFFPQDTTVTLGRSAAEYSRVLAPPGTYALLGNPTGGAVAAISGADEAFTYDPQNGYTPVQERQPGRGAFVLAGDSGVVVLGKAPDGADGDQVAQLQTAIAAHPDDVSNLDKLVAVATDQLQNRQYARVQTVIDDMRATEEDSLRQRKSAPLPTLTPVQHDALVKVREAVAEAQAAAASGNLTMADSAIDAARKAAQAAAEDGTSLPSIGPLSSLLYAGSAQAQTDPVALAQFGTYVRAVIPKTGLATPLAAPERQLAGDLLTSIAFSGPISPAGTISFTVNRDGQHLADIRLATPMLRGKESTGSCTYSLNGLTSDQVPITDRSFTVTRDGDQPFGGVVIHNHVVISGKFVTAQRAEGTIQYAATNTPSGLDCTDSIAFTATSATPIPAFAAVPAQHLASRALAWQTPFAVWQRRQAGG